MNRNLLYAFSLALAVPAAWGCRVYDPPNNAYQQQGKGVIYIQPNDNKGRNLPLAEVNFRHLRRLPDFSIDPAQMEEWEEIPPLTDLATDYVRAGAHSRQEHYSYHSDGRYIVYAGQIVRNPPNKPPVDVATFRAFGDFAADKDSLYYAGERTEDNGGEESVNMKTLRKVVFNGTWNPDWLGLILRDGRYLYVNGRRLIDPDSFTVLAQKSWDTGGKFSATFNPCVIAPFGPWDTLARTRTKIMINGEQLDADPDTFSVVRWMPGSLLSWRDKNGLHRYVLNQDNLDWDEQANKRCAAFSMTEKNVFWRKGPLCEQEEIPGLDPEQFKPINGTVAQYQDTLYVIRKTEFGENRLDTVILDKPGLTIDKRFNAGRNHGYLLTRSEELQIFESSGPLILMDYHVPDERESHLSDSPHYKKWYARDDRYVYAFDGAQLWRYPTPNAKAVRVIWQTMHSRYGYWADFKSGLLDGELMRDGTFIPTGIPRPPFAETAEISPEMNENTFDVGKTAVRWRKALSPDSQWGAWEILPDLDPKQFRIITERIAQYQDRLYIATLSPFGEDQLNVITLDKADLKINRDFNGGKDHAYFIRNDGRSQDVQVITISGQLTTTERFAYDDRYVYTWTNSQLTRTSSPCPEKTRVKEKNVREIHNYDILIIKEKKECLK